MCLRTVVLCCAFALLPLGRTGTIPLTAGVGAFGDLKENGTYEALGKSGGKVSDSGTLTVAGAGASGASWPRALTGVELFRDESERPVVQRSGSKAPFGQGPEFASYFFKEESERRSVAEAGAIMLLGTGLIALAFARTKPRRKLGTLSLVLLACLSAACSGPVVKVQTGKSEVREKDACAILTLADAQAIYGLDMVPSDRNRSATGPGADISTCTYENDRTPMSIATLVVTWNRGGTRSLYERDAYVAQLGPSVPKQAGLDLHVEKVEFLGIPAIWQPALGQMAVFKNGAMATLNADPAPGKDKKQTIEMLMARIAGRL